MTICDAEPTDAQLSAAQAHAIALTQAIHLARQFRLDDVVDGDGKRPQIHAGNVYAVAELYGYDIGDEPTSAQLTAKRQQAPRGTPVLRPANEHITDDGIVCPQCKQSLSEKKYPTIRGGQRDFRRCRGCRDANKNTTKTTETGDT